MPVREIFQVEGHIVDSLILAKVLDLVLEAGGDYRLVDVAIGKTPLDTSRAVLEVTATDQAALDGLAEQLQVHGVNPVDAKEAVLEAASVDGVLPAGFHSTTNLATDVRVGGTWVPVENPEMDCGLVVGAGDPPVVRTVPMHRVRAGDLVVVGHEGVRVHVPARPEGLTAFEFMGSEVSSEKPKGLLVRQVADRMRAVRATGARILAVCGPAVVHTGGGPAVARLVDAGWIDVLFAGNGFATHDIEANVMGTSLGVSVSGEAPIEGGHSNHLRVINEVRRHGSIAAAVEDGFVAEGVMATCVRRGVPFVLGGSIRDDGPLPDTVTDVVEAADLMRGAVGGVGLALMLASTLHSIATGNILPAGVETFCIDINQAVVTKLTDRGSHQVHGIVTDAGLFLQLLSDELGL